MEVMGWDGYHWEGRGIEREGEVTVRYRERKRIFQALKDILNCSSHAYITAISSFHFLQKEKM